jgi:hypothetical protein
MNGKALAMTGSKILAAAAMSIVLGAGLAGCGSGGKKADDTSTVPGGNTGGSGGGTGTTPPPTTPTNTAPTISGSPITTAKVSLPYSYAPTATDVDGDRLTYSIIGKPSWATFDSASGTLAGTPPAGSVGTYTGVQISVSDGKASTPLASFSISVLEPVVGSAELAWQPPTANEDGTTLTDLSGYVIRYGKSSGALDQSVRISNAGTTAYVVENLTEGTWYFTLSSINGAGVESRPTGSVSKTIG